MKLKPEIDHSAGYADLGLGLVLPRRFVATCTPDNADESPPYVVTLEAQFIEGRFECVRLELQQWENGPHVDTEGLRTVPVRHLIRIVAERNIFGERQARDPKRKGRGLVPLSWPVPDVSDGPTESNLRVVSVAYRLAYACGVPPLKHLEESLGLARSTAGRWVKMAREHGYLGATEPGKAGGTAMEV